MKYIAMTILALLTLAAFSLGMFALFDSPIDLPEKPPESKIEFVDKINFYSCDEAHGEAITKLFKETQHCEQHSDCQYKERFPGCGALVLNNDHAAQIETLMNDPTCFKDNFTMCYHGTYPRSEPMCVEQQCQSALAVDPEEEMKIFLQGYGNELHELFFLNPQDKLNSNNVLGK